MTLLTGFLGAGKTTLLNAVLSDGALGKVAVIVNEFGEAGLDHDLIQSGDGEIKLMQSGCLCCSVRGDLSRTVMDLMSRRNRSEVEFDRIVIETTGLADPGPILQTMLVDHYLGRFTRMDGVVTVVDAVNGPGTLDAQFEAVSQIAMSDLIILSKTDIAPAKAVASFAARLRNINATADILHSVKGESTAARISGLNAMRNSATHGEVLTWMRGPGSDTDPLANISGLAQDSPKTTSASQHDDRIATASIVLDQPISDRVFDRWLETLISLRGNDILRVKGIVFLDGVEGPFVFHGVQHIFDPPVQLVDWPRSDRQSRIVVIARDMTRQDLLYSLDMLRAVPTASEH